MACILKVPQPGSAGVVTFTTAERDQAINAHPSTRAAIAALKPRWVIGLHHNWHDHAFHYDPLFDFSMAGEKDLTEVDRADVPLVTLDACNFVPDCFGPGQAEPWWDLLYVARPVFFKGFGQFLASVRQLYDRGNRLRVLCIAPVPPPSMTGETVTDVRERYDELFSPSEQELFNLLTLDFRYPFPFDLPTLAHFYRSSRAFVHFAPDERRCRVAAYAWATGIPVIGMESVGSLLPPSLRHPPFFHCVDRYEQFPDRILEALEATSIEADFGPARREVTPPETLQRLFARLHEITDQVAPTVPATGGAFEGLDIRLGRHHGLASGTNAVAMKVGEFASLLADDEPRVAEAVRLTSDPEVALSADTAPVARAVAPPRRRRRRDLFRRAR